MGTQFHFDPDTYLDSVRAEIPGYERLQTMVAEATSTVEAHAILDLGSGTGITAERVLAMHPHAQLVGIDSSEDMLAHAREMVPAGRFLVARLQDALPPGEYDVVVSAFAIHHLDGPEKADLFRRVAAVLRPGGRFVVCDVVISVEPVRRPVPLTPEFDRPDTVEDQLVWLTDAGLEPDVVFARDDLAVLAADRWA